MLTEMKLWKLGKYASVLLPSTASGSDNKCGNMKIKKVLEFSFK